ncbi:CHAT domain-containing protein [Cyanobium sp. Morenito 9A2]|uniref:CHAT domain-containing protein n=1 Tax=Cyanobium sp. Morenito 9A2 TaxID=2823718 RepID=UPI0020CDA9EC|nr:CHAT domain-containing protein [Cyanobium sp. Morenito 9A2]MCP9850053.1 CHAT domain-containing protein [Cyanobium sp. Morenito 9A2]
MAAVIRPLVSLVLLTLLAPIVPGRAATPVVSPAPSAPVPAQPGAAKAAPGRAAAVYRPGILRLAFSAAPQASSTPGGPPLGKAADEGFIDVTFVPPEGPVIGKRVHLSVKRFADLLRALYGHLARFESLDVGNPASPSRRLHALLIAPIEPELRQRGITTLLVSVDAGLQALPLAALHDGKAYFGQTYAFSITPSLGLMVKDLPRPEPDKRVLSAGASVFEGLSPLPLVPQELANTSAPERTDRFLNRAFTPDVVLVKAGESQYQRVHVATHAEFLPGGPDKSLIFSGTGPVSLARFAALRQRRQGVPLDLFSLSACRTALGNQDSELGFSGLALQSGSRSAMGTLWYVDDVAAAAFFIQFYRYLDRGQPKAEALQRTREAFIDGQVRLQGDRIVGSDSQPLLADLTPAEQRRVSRGLQHPFYWAGIELLGTPW